jgi:hypothetical protein
MKKPAEKILTVCGHPVRFDGKTTEGRWFTILTPGMETTFIVLPGGRVAKSVAAALQRYRTARGE